MIIKARAGQGGQALARYLEGGKNEHAEILGFRHIDPPSLKAAIYDMDMLAQHSQCHAHAYHVQMRAAEGENLNHDQWREAVERVAQGFGMQDHQAAAILHNNPDGSTHCHIVFNRVHPETLKAADLWQDRFKCKDLARELERDFNLQQVSNDKTKPRDHSRAGEKEIEQARRTGENVHTIRDHIRDAWAQSPDGQSFQAALEAQGYTLAKGDRRDYVALDEHGKPYSIGSRTTGAKAAEVREKLKDLTPDQVPSIEQAKQHQQERRTQQREPDHQAERIKEQWHDNQHQPEPATAYSIEGASGAVVDWWKAARNRLDHNQPTPEPEAPTNAWQEMHSEPPPPPERELTREEKIAARLAKYEEDLIAARERKNEQGNGRSRKL